ncbi:phosphoglucomutase-2 [Sphaeroforma arctica JP610]|uniref:Phosphoglucomutase-2 n=1 Tax=Sphaeroforma arctica JP610 TaxID=667725 RepID=A0A0L0GCN4_9EUKA|nr:phosphoglucomutase-2 [Sphaeroforma arctica JP610]KNC86775.1 phosphoglucomutase-2 [Sphaeroforma arctica JP610]|eukprot:XP_014160677.1 phosphoglucomutase-2 [Sphaeroforma arctica JP610]
MSFNKTGNSALDAALISWFESDKSEWTRKELNDRIAANDIAGLESIMLEHMEFGTAGLRARMGAGYACMNDLTVLQAAQGLCRYLQEVNPDVGTQGVVVGHDHRHHSSDFAKITAAVFMSQNIPVHYYKPLACTPMVPFGVIKFGAAAGVMVTASHNPKDDNGYKVYWSNGAQIIPPHDSGIAGHILKNQKPWDGIWESFPTIEDKIECQHENVLSDYITQCTQRSKSMGTEAKNAKITYTAMHGVGTPFVARIFKSFEHPDFIPCKEQVQPDPEFPTVAFPNPEEGKSALNLSMAEADRSGSELILANDPDADRLAVAEKQRNGEWKVFNGNETACLLSWWVYETMKKQNPGANPADYAMVASTVSSKYLAAMAKKEGFTFEDTLTGFKWIGNRAIRFTQEGKKVLFGYEEAIGFMVGVNPPDKDGVHAAAVFGEMMQTLYGQGKKLSEQLDALYVKYGYFISKDSYFKCSSQDTINALFKELREPGYPKACGRFGIKNIRDCTTGFDNRYSDNKSVLPTTADIQMITFYFDNGAVVTMRTSGTEPKIKYYSELPGPLDEK